MIKLGVNLACLDEGRASPVLLCYAGNRAVSYDTLYLEDRETMLSLLLNAKSPCDLPFHPGRQRYHSWCREGFTALHLACQYSHVKAVKMLLDQGADVWREASGSLPCTDSFTKLLDLATFTPLSIAEALERQYQGHASAQQTSRASEVVWLLRHSRQETIKAEMMASPDTLCFSLDIIKVIASYAS